MLVFISTLAFAASTQEPPPGPPPGPPPLDEAAERAGLSDSSIQQIQTILAQHPELESLREELHAAERAVMEEIETTLPASEVEALKAELRPPRPPEQGQSSSPKQR